MGILLFTFNLLSVMRQWEINNVIHNDLKPSNIAYERESGRVSLIDVEMALPLSLLNESEVYQDSGRGTHDYQALLFSLIFLNEIVYH